MNILCILIFGLLLAAVFVGETRAETFETLVYTPPTGWTKQESPEKTVYQRKSGVGAIIFYAGYQTNGSAADEFAVMWKARLEPTLAVKPPQPQIEREGDFTAAVGAQTIKLQDATTTAVLTVFVGRGRAICIVSLSAGDDVLREVMAFFDSLKSAPATSAAQTNSGAVEFDYRVPTGLTAKNDGQMILLTPPKPEINVCAYWLSPPRPSKGSLEADARTAVLELPIEGKIYDEYANAMRGTAPDGWKYFLFGADFRNSLGTSTAYAMALAFPAGAGKVNIVLGVGSGGSNCYLLDANFVRLFHTLSPRGWTSDGGKAFSRELAGLWRWTAGGAFSYSNNYYLTQYDFAANGRYASGGGSIATSGNLETTTTRASDGSYKLSGSELTLTPDARRNASKYLIRIYENYSNGKWRRKMALFSEELGKEVEYDRIEN